MIFYVQNRNRCDRRIKTSAWGPLALCGLHWGSWCIISGAMADKIVERREMRETKKKNNQNNRRNVEEKRDEERKEEMKREKKTD